VPQRLRTHRPPVGVAARLDDESRPPGHRPREAISMGNVAPAEAMDRILSGKSPYRGAVNAPVPRASHPNSSTMARFNRAVRPPSRPERRRCFGQLRKEGAEVVCGGGNSVHRRGNLRLVTSSRPLRPLHGIYSPIWSEVTSTSPRLSWRTMPEIMRLLRWDRPNASAQRAVADRTGKLSRSATCGRLP